MYSTNRKSKTKPSAVAHVVNCVCTLLILACGVEIERPPGEPVEDCRAQPETCQAPNQCLESTTGNFVCVRSVLDMGRRDTGNAPAPDFGMSDCRNDGVGCTSPAICTADDSGIFDCRQRPTASDSSVIADSGQDASLPLDQGQDASLSLDLGRDAAVQTDATVAGPTAVEPPEEPLASTTVRSVVVTIKTADREYAGTDAPMEMCFGRAGCFTLNVRDVDDRERGETEVYHFQTQKPRELFEEMTLRTTDNDSDNDRWSPACVDVRFNGEPVYCNDNISIHLGTGDSTGEVPYFTEALNSECTSCWDTKVTHGPMVGPSAPDSIRIWMRTDATRLVGLRLSATEDLSNAPIVAWTYPTAADDFTAVLTAGNLRPDTLYYYRVEVDGDTSETVRTVRTAPLPNARGRLRIGLGSCSRLDEQPIFNTIFAQQPDMFLFMGDNNYANTHHLDALRWHYRRFRNIPERATLLAHVPTLATWDDHDFLANNSNGTCVDRDIALDAFGEYWANPAAGLDETPGVFFNYQHGAVELFMLDCRMYRPDIGDSGLRCEVSPNPPLLSLEDGPLGRAQEAWLRERLNASTADFKLIGCGSRFTPEGSTDSWASYDVARNRLLEFIDEDGIEGVAFLSGDIHRSSFGVVRGYGYDIPEFTSSPLAYRSASPCPSSAEMERFCFDDGNSFVTIDVDATLTDPTLTGRIHNEVGRVVYEWVVRKSELR